MVSLIDHGVYLLDGKVLSDKCPEGTSRQEAEKATISSRILDAHRKETSKSGLLRLSFDALASHDITYVGILQTARAAGLEKLEIPYVLTNCHNSLCAVGGTINEDDHVFGLSAAKKYGAVYVPAHMAVIHAFMRENYAGCGKMILGSDSHTRYGALGTLGVGEGGPELVKQILGRTYDLPRPETVAVYLKGTARPFVGPHDVALALIGKVYPGSFVKNRILEFVGEGVSALPMEFRNGIDVMTTETAALSSVWVTDEKTRAYLKTHRREEDYRPLAPGPVAYYDRAVVIDLSKIEPMIALPFHPSNVFKISELNENGPDILRETEKAAEATLHLKEGALDLTGKYDRKEKRVRVSQGVIAGCAGGIFDNLTAAADLLRGKTVGNGSFSLSVYPASQPCLLRLTDLGLTADLIRSGVTLRSAFCGPCFGAGDVPANGGLSVRHTTRNFPNREGSKPSEGQTASVALMDARSIAATSSRGGLLTGADETDCLIRSYEYEYDPSVYEGRVYRGFGHPVPEEKLVFGPNITDWPETERLGDDLMIGVCSVIADRVTTTDELIPSGESSSYRSNPIRLSRMTLSRRDPLYVQRADGVRALTGKEEKNPYVSLSEKEIQECTEAFRKARKALLKAAGKGDFPLQIGSMVCARCPGDGSAREQAASCQRVLGALANLSGEYATKRYRSNLINWGMLPLQSKDFSFASDEGKEKIETGDWLLIPGAREKIAGGESDLPAYLYHAREDRVSRHVLSLGDVSEEERKILLAGSLTGFYREDRETVHHSFS